MVSPADSYRGQHGVPIAGELGLANAVNLRQLGKVPWPARRRSRAGSNRGRRRRAARQLRRRSSAAPRAAPRTADRPVRRSRRARRRLRGGGTAMVRLSSPFRIGLRAGPEAEPAIGVGAQRVAGDQRPRHRPHQRHLVGAWRCRTPTGGDGRSCALSRCRCRRARRRDARRRTASRCGTPPTAICARPRSRRCVAGGSRQLSQLPH